MMSLEPAERAGHRAGAGMGPASCLPSRRTVVLGAVLLASVAALGTGLIPADSQAGLDVLSDMDCVIEPSAVVDLGSAVPGLLSDTYFDRSDYVSRHTIMAQLESDVERLAVEIAEQVAESSTAVELRELTAALGERTRVRNEQLLTTSGVSRQLVDQVSTEALIASLQVQQERESRRLAALEVQRSQALLDRRQIRSPIDGTVVKRFKSAGEYVDSDPVYQIAQLDPLHIEVIVPLEFLGKLEVGMNAAVTINVPGFENSTLSAELRRIDAVIDAASATYGVRLVLPNPELSIPSGVRCQIDFIAS